MGAAQLSFLLSSAFHCLTALLLAAPRIFGSQGICYLFCFGFIEFTVLYCGDDDSTLLFQDQRRRGCASLVGEGSRDIVWTPLLHPHDDMRWGYLSTWWNSYAVSSLGVQTVISRERLRRGWVSEFWGRKWNDINMIAFKRCWNFRNDVEISETEFQKKDVFIVQLKRKKGLGRIAVCFMSRPHQQLTPGMWVRNPGWEWKG